MPKHANNYSEPVFRGWVKPGPVPPGAMGKGPEMEPGESLDAVSGYFRLFQLEKGHRFSTDDVLAAWYGSSWAPTARTVLDLGSGIGTVATIAAWRMPAARFVTIEAQSESVRLAKKSVAWNGVDERFNIREGDFRDEQCFEPEERFDLVFGSPPYFPEGTGPVGDHPQKIACRFELRGDISDYCRVAAARLSPAGVFAAVFPVNPPEQHDRVTKAASVAGLTIIRSRPVVFREGEMPLIGLFLMTRSADLPEWMQNKTWSEPALIIRTKSGEIHPEYSAVKLSFGFPP